jgi:hypothetical protein
MAKNKVLTGTLWILSLLISNVIIYHFTSCQYSKQYKIDKERTKKQIVAVMHNDIKNTKRDLDLFLHVRPRGKWDEGNTIIFNDFNTYIFDAYIKEIPLFPAETANRINLFYRDLKTANDTNHKLQNKDLNLTNESKNQLTKVFYDQVEDAVKKGEDVMKDFEKQYPDLLEDINNPNLMAAPASSTLSQRLPYSIIPLDSNSNLLDTNK